MYIYAETRTCHVEVGPVVHREGTECLCSAKLFTHMYVHIRVYIHIHAYAHSWTKEQTCHIEVCPVVHRECAECLCSAQLFHQLLIRHIVHHVALDGGHAVVESSRVIHLKVVLIVCVINKQNMRAWSGHRRSLMH